MMCGGISNDVKQADDDLQQLINGLKDKIQEECKDLNPTEFTTISYKTQVVAGTNYFVKVSIGNGQFIHVKVFKPLPHTGEPAKLSKVETGVGADTEISAF